MPRAPVNVLEFEAIAREKMTPSAYDYYAGGAEDEVTLARNREAFQHIALRPRVLAGTASISTRKMPSIFPIDRLASGK